MDSQELEKTVYGEKGTCAPITKQNDRQFPRYLKGAAVNGNIDERPATERLNTRKRHFGKTVTR